MVQTKRIAKFLLARQLEIYHYFEPKVLLKMRHTIILQTNIMNENVL